MANIKSIYYERFIQHVVDEYSAILKAAKPGNCMKITGLAMKELQELLPRLRAINPALSVFILSETEKGDSYIHATKLIALRNDPDKSVLILVPSNNRTAMEDSYGDATFKNLDAAELQWSFCAALERAIPNDKEYIWNQIKELLKEIHTSRSAVINYLLYIDQNQFDDEAWGNGLFLFGILPDKDLIKDDATIRRRFMINVEKVTSALSDFSITAPDRIAALPLEKNTIQKDLMAFLTTNKSIKDALTLYEEIHDHHPEFNYANMPWQNIGDGGAVKVTVDIVPGKDPAKELVKADDGTFILSIPKDRKGKIGFNIATNPSPKDNPDIFSFEISMVDVNDLTESKVIKKAKVGTNKRASRKLNVNIPFEMFPDGVYMLRGRVLDENGIPLEIVKEFKEDIVQRAWEAEKAQNPSLQIDQYREDNHVAFCYESAAFTIMNDSEIETGDDNTTDKRAKVDCMTQAIILYRALHLGKQEFDQLDFTNGEGADRNKWQEGNLNNTYQFDFGPTFAYQIQLSKKLMELERTFLNNEGFGHVEALLSGNPTDTKMLNPRDTAFEKPLFVEAKTLGMPDELVSLRLDLFDLIKESAADGTGLVSTFDFLKNNQIIINYIEAYDAWLHEKLEMQLNEQDILEIQNLDTVLLSMEMPDGSISKIKMLTPLHPLRLAWTMNLLGLYQDWEQRTLDNTAYCKYWKKGRLNNLFAGGLQQEVAPLVLTDSSLKEAYQYIGELTFGWAVYAQPSFNEEEAFASGYRQLKAYAATLLNVTTEKRIDSDVNLLLVYRHIFNYVLAHPYTDKLIINLFNAGDAAVFAMALVALEKQGIGRELSYEIRLFSDDNMLQAGDALKNLLDPESNFAQEAEVFSQAAFNRLFPKLRFSLNKISDFINHHDLYPAHLSFLVNPFAVHTELVRPDELSRSFYLNGTICRNIVSASQEGKSFVWNRYFSNKVIPNPCTASANFEVSLFARLQETTGKLLSSTLAESVPATTLRLKESDMMLLSFVHDSSDWVVTFDKNMGPEFYDLPCIDKNDVPYLLDYVPGDEATGVSSYLTTKPTSEIEAIMIPLFKEYGIDITKDDVYKELLEDVRSVSSSLIMQVNATSRKGFEVIGTTLTKRFLEKKRIMKESFLIPIDLHKELFEDLESENKERADNLVVKIDTRKREILFTVVEIKCRNAGYEAEELHHKMVDQIENTILALRQHFEIATNGQDRLDRELKTLELKSFLEFYIRRSMRYGQLDPAVAHDYMVFMSKLADGYTMRFKELGVIFDFTQGVRQQKFFYGDAVIYTMGYPVIEDVIDRDATLNTKALDDKDRDFLNYFEPSDMFLTEIPQPEVQDKPEEKETPVTPQPTDIPKDVPPVEPQHTEAKPSVHFDTPATDKPEPEQPKPQTEQPADDETDTPEPLTHVTVTNKVPYVPEPEDPNYVDPQYDVIIGNNGESPQYGIIGKMVSNGRIIGLDLNQCNTISLFGVQGAGKSYTIGSVSEMVLRQFSKINRLPAPMASVIFHYSDSMEYAPEFTSMIYPNDDAGQLAKLKAEYGAEPGNIKDVVLLAPQSQVERRKLEYPNIDVYPIEFDSSELQVKDWTFLLGAVGNDSTYIKELKKIMKGCRNNITLQNIRDGVANDPHMSAAQKSLAEQKLDFADEYINDGNQLKQHLRPGRLIIVDLRDEFIEKDEALGLFVVMLNIFSSVMQVDGQSFNKFIVFDEAHKYMNDKDLVSSITTTIREMRHYGVSIMIASQDPMSLPTEIIELSSIVVMHRFSSPAWVKHVQKAITPLQTLTPNEMANLGTSEAYLWANKSSDKAITQRPIKISIRPRVTKHGGDTIQAVK